MSRSVWPWLAGMLLAATAVRVWMTFSLDASILDAVPITESNNSFGLHDPVSLFWGHFLRLFLEEPSLWWFRFPSLVASVVTVASVTMYGARRYGTLVGVMAGSILSVAFPLVVTSCIVRGYSVHVLGIWLMASALDGLLNEGKGSRRLVVGAMLAAAHQWSILFATLGAPLLAAMIFLHTRSGHGQRLRRHLRDPDTIRTVAAAALILGFLAATLTIAQAIVGMKDEYQHGMSITFISDPSMLWRLLLLVSRPLLSLVGGPHWLGIPWYLLAAWGLVASWRSRPGGIAVIPAAWCAYCLIPVLVDLTFGSVASEIGHWAFLIVPMALWVSLGAVKLVPTEWSRTGAGRWMLSASVVIALAISMIPNLQSINRYADRGYHLAFRYSWTDTVNRIDGALGKGGNLLFMESARFFLASHMFSYTYAKRDTDITFLSERLPGSPLFRRFLLHDLCQAPGTFFPLHRWQDFEGLARAVTHWTGRVILVLPNPEDGSYTEWFGSGASFLPRRCEGRPRFGPDVRWSGDDNGWVVWFDAEREPVGRLLERIQRIFDAHADTCAGMAETRLAKGVS